MIAWAGWALLVSALLGLAALAAEKALGLYRRPTRWAWAAAMAASVALPLALLLVPASPPAPPPADAGAFLDVPLAIGTAVDTPPEAPSPAERLAAVGGRVFPRGWGVATLGLLAFLGLASARLARARRRWRAAEVAGINVLETDDLGPAVVGVFRTRIAIPRWVRELDERLQALVVRHEREHERAGDPRLVAAGLLACAFFPWSLALWWQLRRLRLAIEVDCDRRVLAAGAPLGDYGALLLEVGRRASARPLPLVALYEPRSFLERRFTAMTAPRPRNRFAIALAFVLVGSLVAGATAVLPVPKPPVSWIPGADPSTGVAADTVQTVHVLVMVPYEKRDISSVKELRRIVTGPSLHPATWRRILDRAVLPEAGFCSIRVTKDGAVLETGVRENRAGAEVTDSREPSVCFLVEARVGPDSPRLDRPDPFALALGPEYRDVETIEEILAAGYRDYRHDLGRMEIFRKGLLRGRGGSCGMRRNAEDDVAVFRLAPGDQVGEVTGTCFFLVPEGSDRSKFRLERVEREPEGARAAPDPADGAILARFEGSAESLRCNVVVGIRIGPTGTVTATDMLRSSQAGCDEPVREWARSTRWTPAEEDGELVEVWIAQPVRIIKEPRPAESGA